MSSTSNLDRIPILEEDPYKPISFLGKGAYGVVAKVEREGKVYARKTIIFSTTHDHEKTLRDTQSEFTILSRLKHKHIVEVVEMFYCQKQFHIVMAQVAESNMKEFLEHVDGMSDERRNSLRKLI
jgi:serine/threonine protein kinase